MAIKTQFSEKKSQTLLDEKPAFCCEDQGIFRMHKSHTSRTYFRTSNQKVPVSFVSQLLVKENKDLGQEGDVKWL